MLLLLNRPGILQSAFPLKTYWHVISSIIQESWNVSKNMLLPIQITEPMLSLLPTIVKKAYIGIMIMKEPTLFMKEVSLKKNMLSTDPMETI